MAVYCEDSIKGEGSLVLLKVAVLSIVHGSRDADNSETSNDSCFAIKH